MLQLIHCETILDHRAAAPADKGVAPLIEGEAQLHNMQPACDNKSKTALYYQDSVA
jgi:hypothetical protein